MTVAEGHRERIGRYAVRRRLASGAFAEVFEGHDEVLDVAVAVKVLHTHLALEPESRQRFTLEARLLRRFEHPALLAVHDVGQMDDGRPFMVADFASGGTLADRLDGRIPSPGDVEAAVDTLAGGLAALHHSGIVHRDISTSNVLVFGDAGGTGDAAALLAAGERLVLGDLGLALDLGRSGGGLTAPAGTPRYRAPEQLRPGDPVDHRTDVYGATAVMWELVCGTPPPFADDVAARLHEAPVAWQGLFERGLAATPEGRFDTIDAWRDAAQAALALGPTGLARPEPWPTDRSPYRGLGGFDPADGAVYFGRAGLVTDLVERIATHDAVLVGGVSGAGKSSLLRAGLTSGRSAFDPATGPGRIRYVTAGRLDIEELEQPVEPGRRVVIVDQFEQLLVGDAPSDMIDRIAALAGGDTTVVVGLRSDFYGVATRHPWLADLVARHLFVTDPTRDELRQMVEGPAHVAGIQVEPALVDRAVDDAAGQRSSLPLLAFALEQLWADGGGGLTLAAYEQLGGLDGAIARSGAALAGRLSASELNRLRRVMLGMVTPSPGGAADTGRRLLLDTLDAADRAVLDQAVAARLVTVGVDGAELAHESVIDGWPLLRSWVDDEREQLRVRDDLDQAAGAWVDGDRTDDLLLRGARLATAEEWRSQQAGPVDADVVDLVDASNRAVKRRQRIRSAALVVAAMLTVVALVASVLAVGNARRAGSEADENLARRLGVDAVSGRFPLDLSLLLALEGARLAPDDPVVLGALGQLVEARPGRLRWEARLEGRGLETWFNEDGTRVGAATAVGQVAVFDAGSGAMLGQFRHPGAVTATALVGSSVVVGGAGPDVAVYDIDRLGAGPTVSIRHDDVTAITSVAVDADGDRIVTSGSDGSVHVWDRTGTRLASFDAGGPAWSVAVTDDGGTVATAGRDGTRLWSVVGQEVASLEPPVAADADLTVWHADFSADGRFVGGAGQGYAVVWDAATGEVVHRLHDRCTECKVWDIEFSPDGEVVATSGGDGTAQFADVATGDLLATRTHGNEVTRVRFAPDGTQAVSSAKDDLARFGVLRSLSSDEVAHLDWVWSATFSADGRRLATVSSDQTVRVSDADGYGRTGTWRPLGPVVVLDSVIVGDHAVVLDEADEITVWEVATGRRTDGFAPGSGLVATGRLGEVVVIATETEGLLLGRVEADGRWTTTGAIDLSGPAEQLHVSADGRSLAIVSGSTVTWIDATGRALATVNVDVPAGLALDGADAMWVALRDGSVVAVSPDGASEMVATAGEVGDVLTVAADGDGLLAVGGRTASAIVDVGNGTVTPLPTSGVTGAAFVPAPGGQVLVAGGPDGRVWAIDPVTGRIRWEAVHGDRVERVFVDPSGRRVLTDGGGQANGVWWDVESGTRLAGIGQVRSGAVGLDLSADGRWVVAGTGRGALTAWTAPAQWPEVGCDVAGRTLTVEEWDRHVGGDRPGETACGAFGT